MKSFPRGSEWRKWDLHVHTPESVLNNQFGSDWDNFVKMLFKKAIEENISAIGITDYFSIEGYKKIKKEYLECESKLKELFTPEEIETIHSILILPNIEFRLNKLIGSNRINFHVIFSNDLNENEIEENFLHEIDFVYQGNLFSDDENRKLKLSNLISLGKKLQSEHAHFNGQKEIFTGMMNAVVDDAQISKILNSKPSIFEGNYLLGLPCDEDLSTISWNGQDHQTRKVLVQKSNALFSRNSSTIKWALGLKSTSIEAHVKEFNSIKPCLGGSDAHTFDELFSKNKEKQTWIKADLTFSGLKQILYEPSQRILLQEQKPDDKNDYLLIDTIKFIDNNFLGTEIVLNQNLNTIIGGKSTGKSIILRTIAKAIDYNEVKRRLNEVGLPDYMKVVDDFEVIWKDKQKSSIQRQDINKNIIYIPQSYLNRLVEKEEGSSIEEIIKNVLLQEENVKHSFEHLEDSSRNIQKEISKTTDDIFFLTSDWNKQKSKIKQIGDKKGVEEEIAKLETEVNELKSKSGLSTDEINLHSETQKEIDSIKIRKANLSKDSYKLNQFKSLNIANDIAFDFLDKSLNKELEEKYRELKNDFINNWRQFVDAKLEEQTALIYRLDEESVLSENKILDINTKISQASLLEQKLKKLEEEKSKLTLIVTEEEYLTKIANEYFNKRDSLSYIHNKFYEDFHYHKDQILSQKSIEGDISFNLKVGFKAKSFQKFIDEVFNLKQVSKFTHCNLLEYSHTDNSTFNDHIKKIILGIIDEDIVLKNNYSKKDAILKLLDNWYAYNYEVTQNGDIISEMSPGKKSFVLLKLLIELDNSNCPILIDQPEDDLDNRSIYDELVKFIKEKKQKRQFIIVTHNPNLVVSADAEEIIVANQHGDKTQNKSFRFEYITGSLENSFTLDDAEGILNKQGIQEHVCQILEGGREAFEQRKNKYNF